MKIETVINGVAATLKCDAQATLLDALRAAGYKSVKVGCREGMCGACTVLVDGVARHGCQTPAALVAGRQVTTVEALGTPNDPHPLQQAFVDVGAVQCGFCTPGAILSAKALLDRTPRPSAEEIRVALDGNLCRCTGYVKMVEAVETAAQRLGEEGSR